MTRPASAFRVASARFLEATGRLAGSVGEHVQGVMDLVYPPACILCGCDRPDPPRDSLPLCQGCEAEFITNCATPGCEACGRPVGLDVSPHPFDGRLPPCPWCDGRGVGRVKRVARMSLFAGPVRQLIHQVKFHSRWELADALGDRLSQAEPARQLVAAADVLVPMPLHSLRQAQRGFNQSDRIAWRLGRRLGRPVIHPAIRSKPTAAQSSLESVTARQANLREAFALLHPEQICGRNIVIVDDVTTSGATLRSFAHCLHTGRPKAIWACVLAVADANRRDFKGV